MPRKREPQRQTIIDCLSGVVARIDGTGVLLKQEPASGEILIVGDIFIRYGITFLGKPQLSIVPGLVVADYGDHLIGEQAWAFLMERAHLHPRADVCGARSDGEEDMAPLKLLDFDHPYHVFAYRNVDDRQPAARLSAIIAPNRIDLPRRALRNLPCYDSLSEWRRRV